MRAPFGVTPLAPAPRNLFCVRERPDIAADTFDVHCPHGLVLGCSGNARYGFRLHELCGQPVGGMDGVRLDGSSFTRWLTGQINSTEEAA